MKLTEHISAARPAEGELAVFYLAQAGFYFKTAKGKTVCIDPYLSDCCERMFNFKRMVPALMMPDELQTDWLISTHSHADHLDPDLLECAKLKPETRFTGSTDCLPVYRRHGIASGRITVLAAGESLAVDDIEFRAVYADHGELAPEAVGFLITIDGITVYDTGDTCYCPGKIMNSLGGVNVDIMIVPVNPAFGNPGHENAVRLGALIKPQVLIASHFGMFIEHGGDPGSFLEYARKTLPEAITPIVMAPGELLIYSEEHGIKEMKTLKQDEIYNE